MSNVTEYVRRLQALLGGIATEFPIHEETLPIAFPPRLG